MPKVTVYIPIHNYGRYVEQAIKSVLRQTMADWELILINDGSTDNTSEVIKRYASHPKIRIIEQVKKGLNISNNVALRLSNAKFFMRLDADDYLDENALLVLSNTLEAKSEVGLVYPDYYHVDEEGEVLEVVRRKKIGEESKLLDLPALGACTMFRKECLLDLGGYQELYQCQDGYELWLRFIQSFKPYNVNVPLFYYRQHEGSLTKDHDKILRTRGAIKRHFVQRFKKDSIPKVLAVIPAMKQSLSSPESPFTKLCGKTLLSHTLRQAASSSLLEKIVVTSDSEEILSYCRKFKHVTTVKRPRELSSFKTKIGAVVVHVLAELKKKKYVPDAVLVLPINTPLRKAMHIQKAIDTMTIFNVDTVVSVCEELAYCYLHGEHGLVPIRKSRDIRIEKKAIYKETGALLLSRTEAITAKTFYGEKIGHIIMLPEESVKIKSHFDLWLAEKILADWQKKKNGK